MVQLQSHTMPVGSGRFFGNCQFLVALCFSFLMACSWSPIIAVSSFVVSSPSDTSARRSRVTSSFYITPRIDSFLTLSMVGPGVVVADPLDIRKALQNPATTVVDARSMEELQSNGYFTYCESSSPPKCKWLHAPSTAGDMPPSSPLIQLASASILPDLHAPIIVHCGSGIRAGAVKQILEGLGYTNVLNAGGLTDLEFTLAG